MSGGTGAGIGEWLRMGGYAAFVWPSYALVLGIVIFNIVSARRSLADARRLAKRRLAAARSGE